jgi:hypothetical protein
VADESFFAGTKAELIVLRRIDDQLLPAAQTLLLTAIMQG